MKTVLLIEDNTDIRENMGEILELADYRVLLAPDGKQGVELALQELPDIIICDIMMPELDGYGVIHLLQKHDATRHIPFIFLTAKAERAEMRRGMELGADDYITKPFSGSELLSAIEGRLKKAAGKGGPVSPAAPAGRSLAALFEAEADSRELRKKERIYSEGQQAYRLFRVGRGKVKLFRTNDEGKDLITTICGEGEYFGYSALLRQVPYQEAAETLEDAVIDSVTREAFLQLTAENPEVMREFAGVLAGDVHQKEGQLLGLAYNSLRKKVAEALLLLHRKHSGAAMHVSRDNLAAIAGTAKESLIRTLGDFRDEGLIEVRASEIRVLDERKLAGLVN